VMTCSARSPSARSVRCRASGKFSSSRIFTTPDARLAAGGRRRERRRPRPL
jgi:hypothetical protein